MKKCNSCQQIKAISDFPNRTVNGKKYPRTYCKPCYRFKDTQKPGYKERSDRNQKKYRDKMSLLRKDSSHHAKFICRDSKSSDSKHDRENDLSVDFVESLIATGCNYCGTAHLRMTLDRIDNTIGHIESNVVPACIRCNLTRGSMPFEAWNIVSKGMRVAAENGLFGSWTRGIHDGK